MKNSLLASFYTKSAIAELFGEDLLCLSDLWLAYIAGNTTSLCSNKKALIWI